MGRRAVPGQQPRTVARAAGAAGARRRRAGAGLSRCRRAWRRGGARGGAGPAIARAPGCLACAAPAAPAGSGGRGSSRWLRPRVTHGCHRPRETSGQPFSCGAWVIVYCVLLAESGVWFAGCAWLGGGRSGAAGVCGAAARLRPGHAAGAASWRAADPARLHIS